MDFGFTEEQVGLQDQVRRFVASECPLTRVRQIMEADRAYDAALWSKTAELGWQALTVPEAYGGLGLAWEDLIIVAEETGRGLLPSPLLATAAAARLLAALGDEKQKSRWLASIAAGQTVATIAALEDGDVLDERGITCRAEVRTGGEVALHGSKSLVAYGQAADLFLVVAREQDGVSVFAVESPASGLVVEPLSLVDATQRAADVVLDGVIVPESARLGPAGKAWPAVRSVLDAAAVALAAELVGAADASVAMATEYAKIRRQFGQPIGRFQGVKHRLAELHVAVESARSLVYYAAWAVDHAGDPSMHVSMAKAYASTAADEAGEECIQIHGAIGFTWECDAHLYYKRGRCCRNLMGSPEAHRERVLTSQGL